MAAAAASETKFTPVSPRSDWQDVNLGQGKVWLTFIPQFYSQQRADDIEQALAQELYEPTYYCIAGVPTKSPRRMAWYATDPAWTYMFSANHIRGLPARPLTPTLQQVLADVNAFTNEQFNAVLVNLYDSGRNSVAWHTDDDPWLGSDFTVPSLSFGATRKFRVSYDPKLEPKGQRKPGQHKPSQRVFPLPHGSMIWMRGQTQRNSQHAVATEAKVAGRRFNLTFRRIVPALVAKQPRGRPLSEAEYKTFVREYELGKAYANKPIQTAACHRKAWEDQRDVARFLETRATPDQLKLVVGYSRHPQQRAARFVLYEANADDIQQLKEWFL